MGIENIRLLKMQAGIPKPKKEYVIPKKSAKKMKMEMLSAGDDKALDIWFEDRRKDLTGTCAHCGGKTCKDSDEFYRCSVAHILPKAYFPSVATHPLNFIELCFWKNNCHANMDNKVLDMTDMNCWNTIVERFLAIYPFVEKKEKRRIPSVLLDYLEVDI